MDDNTNARYDSEISNHVENSTTEDKNSIGGLVLVHRDILKRILGEIKHNMNFT